MIRLFDLKGKKVVKDLRVLLKDMEKFVRDPRWLWNGRDFKNFNLRAREIWALWLLCVVVNQVDDVDCTFGETTEGDGVIIDKRSGKVTIIENVAAMDFPNTSLPRGEERIIQAIMHKASYGEKYATGKVLVVFYDGAHRAEPNKVAKSVAGRHHFDQIYLVGLINDKGGTEYKYSVMRLNEKDAQISVVKISSDFSDWQLLDPRNFLS